MDNLLQIWLTMFKLFGSDYTVSERACERLGIAYLLALLKRKQKGKSLEGEGGNFETREAPSIQGHVK